MSEPVHDPHCIFCKIVGGEIPSTRVLETPEALAFLDVGPLNAGHTLLIPRAHHANLAELPDDLAAQLGALLPRLCRAVRAASHATGLNVLVNTGRIAGQTVDHVHWHIIPRFAGDPIHWPWNPGQYSDEERDRIQSRIRHALTEEPGLEPA